MAGTGPSPRRAWPQRPPAAHAQHNIFRQDEDKQHAPAQHDAEEKLRSTTPRKLFTTLMKSTASASMHAGSVALITIQSPRTRRTTANSRQDTNTEPDHDKQQEHDQSHRIEHLDKKARRMAQMLRKLPDPPARRYHGFQPRPRGRWRPSSAPRDIVPELGIAHQGVAAPMPRGSETR